MQAGRGINGAGKGTEDESRAGDGGVCVSGQRMGRLVAREPLLDEQRAREAVRDGEVGAGEDSLGRGSGVGERARVGETDRPTRRPRSSRGGSPERSRRGRS